MYWNIIVIIISKKQNHQEFKIPETDPGYPESEPSTPKLEILEDPTTLVLALNTSPPATPVLHLTGEEDAQTQDTQDLSLEF